MSGTVRMFVYAWPVVVLLTPLIGFGVWDIEIVPEQAEGIRSITVDGEGPELTLGTLTQKRRVGTIYVAFGPG